MPGATLLVKARYAKTAKKSCLDVEMCICSLCMLKIILGEIRGKKSRKRNILELWYIMKHQQGTWINTYILSVFISAAFHLAVNCAEKKDRQRERE